MIRYIAYTSLAAHGLSAAQVDAILLDARRFNADVQVTGVLLYDGERFFQYLEGSTVATDQVMERILRSSRHHHLTVLSDDTNPERVFARWHMGFCHGPQSLLQRMENAMLQQPLFDISIDRTASPALVDLRRFLSTQSQRADKALMTHSADPPHA